MTDLKALKAMDVYLDDGWAKSTKFSKILDNCRQTLNNTKKWSE